MTTSEVGEQTVEPEPEVADPERETGAAKRPRRRKVIAALLALLLACAGVFAWLQSGRAILGTHAGEGILSFLPGWLPDDVAFRYGDREVTVDELDRHVELLRALYGVQPPKGDKRMAAFKRDVAKSYAVSLILDDAAQRRGIEVADKQARDTLSRFVTERLGPGPEAYRQFISTLTDSGTSERVVLAELKRRLAMTQLFETITGGIAEPSDEAVRQAFTAREKDLAQPETRRLSNIVVETKDDAEQVLRELSGGASFADLAARSSLDASTRDSGGDLGAVSRADLEQAYGTAAFATGEGERFGPVRTQHGWNVGTVERIVPAEPARFDAIREDLRQQLASEKALVRWREWLRQVIADASVRYADEYRPGDPAAPPDTSPMEPAGVAGTGQGQGRGPR